MIARTIDDDMVQAVDRALDENARHDRFSLYLLLCRFFPEEGDERILAAVDARLPK